MSLTKQRILILDVINKSYNHPNAYEIYEKCQKTIPNISLGTVYRNLSFLENQNMIKKIKTPNNIDRYDHIDKEHSHFICLKCEKIFDIFENVNLPGIANFEVLNYDIIYKGICKECKGKDE